MWNKKKVTFVGGNDAEEWIKDLAYGMLKDLCLGK